MPSPSFKKDTKSFSVTEYVGYNGLTAEAYDVNSTLLSSLTIDGTGRQHNGPPGGDGFDFLEFDFPGITQISFSQILDADWDRANGLGLEGYLLDDMTFNPVPEPATILLLSSGLIGLAGFRRKYKRG